MRLIEIYRKIRRYGLGESFRKLGLRFSRIQSIPVPNRNRIFSGIASFIEKWWFLNRSNSSTLYAFYDLGCSTPTYDIGSFMPLAEFERQHKGCKDMVLVIVPASDESLVRKLDREQNPLTAEENWNWRLRHIVQPFCALYEHCRGSMICGTRGEARAIFRKVAKHTFPRPFSTWIPQKRDHWGFVEELHKKASDLTTIKVSENAKCIVREWRTAKDFRKPIVTITLRESSYNTPRNSNIQEWIRAAIWLEERGYQPVILRDMEQAFSNEPRELLQWQSFPEVLWNLELRAALYEMAYLNLLVANGPSILCITNKDTRYIQFKQVTPECEATKHSYVEKYVGLKEGQQFCTNGPYQRNVWEADHFEIIKQEFIAMEQRLEMGTK